MKCRIWCKNPFETNKSCLSNEYVVYLCIYLNHLVVVWSWIRLRYFVNSMQERGAFICSQSVVNIFKDELGELTMSWGVQIIKVEVSEVKVIKEGENMALATFKNVSPIYYNFIFSYLLISLHCMLWITARKNIGKGMLYYFEMNLQSPCLFKYGSFFSMVLWHIWVTNIIKVSYVCEIKEMHWRSMKKDNSCWVSCNDIFLMHTYQSLQKKKHSHHVRIGNDNRIDYKTKEN